MRKFLLLMLLTSLFALNNEYISTEVDDSDYPDNKPITGVN